MTAERGSKVSLAKIPTGAEREAYLHLLLFADESEMQVRASMNNGRYTRIGLVTTARRQESSLPRPNQTRPSS